MTNEIVQIKLVRRPSFTGKLGNYSFTDGLSEPMVRREAERLAAVTGVVFVGADSMWERKAKERGGHVIEAPVETPKKVEPVVSVPKPPSGRMTFTREDLEKIADKGGIDGLREIATPMGLKGVQITAMIRAILAAQEAKLRGE